METEPRIRVLLADDHAVLRAGLHVLLDAKPDIEVVGEAADGAEAIAQIEALRPDIVVMDLTMPGLSGLDATQYITEHHPHTKVLVLTMHADKYILPVIRAGAAGYVLKSMADTDLIQAIRQIAQGGHFFYPGAMDALLDHVQEEDAGGEPEADSDSLATLSSREREVLTLTAQGYTNSQISQMLFISPKTVDTYRYRLMEKLGFDDRAELVQYALRKGLLKSDE